MEGKIFRKDFGNLEIDTVPSVETPLEIEDASESGFEVSAEAVRDVSIYLGDVPRSRVSYRDEDLCLALRVRPEGLSNAELMAASDQSAGCVRRHLRHLIALGLVEKTMKNKRVAWRLI
jgi:predicted HTH transcriptional regulator